MLMFVPFSVHNPRLSHFTVHQSIHRIVMPLRRGADLNLKCSKTKQWHFVTPVPGSPHQLDWLGHWFIFYLGLFDWIPSSRLPNRYRTVCSVSREAEKEELGASAVIDTCCNNWIPCPIPLPLVMGCGRHMFLFPGLWNFIWWNSSTD